ncbi:hypothetical protein HQ531_09900 [bacterium]|nr:hypothetical protein [bacterium]
MMINWSVKKLGIIIIIFSLISCVFFSDYAKLERRAREAYSRADYDTAVYMLAQSLQIKQDYEKSQILMKDAFSMAMQIHRNQIAELEQSNSIFKYDELTRQYQSLLNLNDAIKVMPPIHHTKTHVLLSLPITNYTKELKATKKLAAESHYHAGELLAESTDLEKQKSAAKEFKRALRFIPDYKDASMRYETTRQAGIKRIAVFPFEDLSGKKKKYGAVEELVLDQMISSVMNDPSATEFMELISRDQLARVLEEQKLGLTGLLDEETTMEVGAILGVHEIITGKITQVIYTPVQTVHREYKQHNKVVIKTEKYKDKEGKTKTRKVYGEVDAHVKHFSRSTKAVIKGSYSIVDVRTAKVIESESFEGKANYSAEWVTFRGDERALNRNTKKLARRGESLAPVAEEMVSRASADLANSLSATLKIYAR